MLDNVLFQEDLGHPEGLWARIQEPFPQVITVLAGKVAGRAHGFDKNLEVIEKLTPVRLSRTITRPSIEDPKRMVNRSQDDDL